VHGKVQGNPDRARPGLSESFGCGARQLAAVRGIHHADHLRRWRAQKDLEPPARVAQLTSFPRSGTTLLENVLDAHSALVSSEELQVFGRDILDSSWKESHEITRRQPRLSTKSRSPGFITFDAVTLRPLRKRWMSR